LKGEQGDGRDDDHRERVQVQRFVEVSLRELEGGAREAAAGAGVPRDDREGAEGNTQGEGDAEDDGDEAESSCAFEGR